MDMNTGAVKPWTPMGTPQKPEENEALQEDPEYMQALNDVEKTQDRFDRIDTLLKLSPRQRIRGLPQKKAELWDTQEAKYAKPIKYATWGLIGAGIVAGFMAGNIFASLAISIGTSIAAMKGVPRKIIEKLVIEPKVDKVIKADLEKEIAQVRVELDQRKAKLKEAETAAQKRLDNQSHSTSGGSIVTDDDGQVNIGGIRL